jgi:hypothetical protein
LAPGRILLDSNAYFRLADNLYPLLSREFGQKPGYKLCILGGSLKEYNYQARLRSKFDWVDKEKHKEDRKGAKLRVAKEVKEEIEKTRRFMAEACRDLELGCSPFDIECLATAYELKLPLVTDDLDLIELAEEYDHTVMSTLELLDLLLKNKSITIEDIRGTTVMWEYLDDLPSQFEAEYRRLFGEEPDHIQ